MILAAPSVSAQKSSSKPIALFNGKNLDGWYKFLKTTGKDNDPTNVFTVKDGLIHISGEIYGCITTNEEFENYKLVVDFKWGDKTWAPREKRARDNGVLIHSTGKDGGYGGVWMHSLECQIIEGGTGDFLVVGDNSEKFAMTANVAASKQGGAYLYQSGGQPATIHGGRINWFARSPKWEDVLDFRGEHDVEKPVGEWNRMEIYAFDDKIDLFLNGQLVNQAFDVKPRRGRIQIQSEGAEMFVRKVELTPLKSYEQTFLGKPALTKAARDGSLTLAAQSGKGTGPKIKYMPEWKAFGWFTEADHVEWEADVKKAGVYDVYMEWSVSDGSAGNPYIVEANGKTVMTGKVKSTGSWEVFKKEKIGEATLAKGRQVIAFKPDPSLQKAGMLDIRELQLVPKK